MTSAFADSVKVLQWQTWFVELEITTKPLNKKVRNEKNQRTFQQKGKQTLIKPF